MAFEQLSVTAINIPHLLELNSVLTYGGPSIVPVE